MERIEKIVKSMNMLNSENLKSEKKAQNYYYLEFETGHVFNRSLLKIHEDYSKDVVFFKDEKAALVMDFKNKTNKLKIKGHSFIEYQGDDFISVFNANNSFEETFGEVIQKIYFNIIFKSDEIKKYYNYMEVYYDDYTVIIENKKENSKLLKILGKDTLEVTSGPYGYYVFSIPYGFRNNFNRKMVEIFVPAEIQNYRSNMKELKKLTGKKFNLKTSYNFIKNNLNNEKIKYRIKELDINKGDFAILQSANGTISGIVESVKNIADNIRDIEIRTLKDEIRI
jgi:hypothetical protein